MPITNAKYDFSGKVALVTGSSAGIGAAIATQFAAYGAKVTIHGRNAQTLAQVAAEITAVSGGVEPLQIVGDLLDDALPEKLINETVAKFGRLDFLVNNAGSGTPHGVLADPQMLQDFDKIMKLNVRVPVELTQRAVPHLELTKGSIVNISSMASMLPYAVVYCTSKAALDMVTKTSALELGPKGIRVNSINPGFVTTSIYRSRGWDQQTIDDFYPTVAQKSLLKRIGDPDDIANLTSFLVSTDAINITGSIFVSDSGALLAPVNLADEYRKLDSK